MMFILPALSRACLSGVSFAGATPIAEECRSVFSAYDLAGGSSDPSRCAAILALRGCVFWSSKLAIDADGKAQDADHLSGAQLDPADGQNDTSFHFADGSPLSSERHPFIVLPGGPFRAQTGLKLGDVAALVYGDRIAAAICGDIGPVRKIGEASIRVHEAFLPDAPDPCARHPDGSCRRIHDASIARDVLTFAFPGSAFGPELHPDNAEALIKARAGALFAKLHTPL